MNTRDLKEKYNRDILKIKKVRDKEKDSDLFDAYNHAILFLRSKIHRLDTEYIYDTNNYKNKRGE